MNRTELMPTDISPSQHKSTYSTLFNINLLLRFAKPSIYPTCYLSLIVNQINHSSHLSPAVPFCPQILMLSTYYRHTIPRTPENFPQPKSGAVFPAALNQLSSLRGPSRAAAARIPIDQFQLPCTHIHIHIGVRFWRETSTWVDTIPFEFFQQHHHGHQPSSPRNSSTVDEATRSPNGDDNNDPHRLRRARYSSHSQICLLLRGSTVRRCYFGTVVQLQQFRFVPPEVLVQL